MGRHFNVTPSVPNSVHGPPAPASYNRWRPAIWQWRWHWRPRPPARY